MAVDRYRQGGDPDGLVASIDACGDRLETTLQRKLAQHYEEWLRAIRRLEVLHDYLAVQAAQSRWLSRFPAGPGIGAAPITCRLPSGHVVAVPILLEPLRDLQLDARLLTNGAARQDGRVGASPVMIALAGAGVSAADVAIELGVTKVTAWRQLVGETRPSPQLPTVLEQLLGSDGARVLELIPSRNGHG
jgi:hypothetical protein